MYKDSNSKNDSLPGETYGAMKMIEKILCVDDEPKILDTYKRGLRKDFVIETALSGIQALKMIKADGPYAVIVSDMRMPEMDGIQFLKRVSEVAPESVRIMLTSNADQHTAVVAVNEGYIFRFLNKPCPPEVLAKSLTAGLQQYRLVRAEKDLLETTLSRSVEALTDVLSMVNPTAFGRASRVKRLALQLSLLMELENDWQLDLAAMLSQIGCIALPEDTLQKVHEGKGLTPDELRMLQTHPQVGHDLIARIPRLETVAKMILHQEDKYLLTDADTTIPMGSRILKLALDFDKLIEVKLSSYDALAEIERRTGWYHPAVVDALQKVVAGSRRCFDSAYVRVAELEPAMILAADVMSVSGFLLVAKGQAVTPALRQRLENFLLRGGIEEPLKVFIPIEVPDYRVEEFEVPCAPVG
jgi:response regulator RpfG family c-di-GMP phosphodiesterase